MKNYPTVCTSAISTMLKYAAKQGLKANSIFSAADLEFSTFRSPESRMTLKQSDRVIEKAFLLTRCENLGLRAGQFMVPGNWNIVGYMMMSCQTLGEAFDKYCIYERIVSDGNKTKLRVEDDLAILDVSLVADTALATKQHSENILSCMMKLIKTITGEDIGLREVRFKHRAPKNISDYRHIFCAPLSFQQSSNALLFDKDYLDLPLVQPNRNLLFLFEQHAKKIMKQLTPKRTYTLKVKQVLLGRFPEGTPDIERVARKLGMSARNLQLKLRAEGTSYQVLLDEFRKDLAFGYLKKREISVADVAYLLGFSEPSAFSRTFKRWTGITPGEYRILH